MRKHIKSIVSLFLILIMALSLAGCGEIKKAEKTVENTFKALKSLDFEAASYYIDIDEIMKSEDGESDTLSLDDNVFMKNLFDKLEYEIISSEKIDENTVVVKTKITAVDMRPVLKDFFSKALQYAFANAFSNPQPSEEETTQKMEEMFIECISGENLAMISNEVDIKVIKVDGKWKIESAHSLSNALLGDLEEAVEEINKSFSALE